MKRPVSFSLLLAFIAWSIVDAVQSLLRPIGTQTLFAYYDLTVAYYVDVLFVIVGGCAFAYVLLRREKWGYVLGQAWLALGVCVNVFVGWVAYTNQALWTDMLTAMSVYKGRSTEQVASYTDTPVAMFVAVTTAFALVALCMYFMWYLRKHRDFLQN